MPDTPPEEESADQRAIRVLVARVPGADRVLAEHLAENEDDAGERNFAAVAALRSFAPPATAERVAKTLQWYGRAEDGRPRSSA